MKLVDDKSDLAWIRGFSSKQAWPVARPEGEKHRRPWMSDAAQVGEQPEINSRRKTECVDCLSTPYLVAITISPELHVRLGEDWSLLDRSIGGCTSTSIWCVLVCACNHLLHMLRESVCEQVVSQP